MIAYQLCGIVAWAVQCCSGQHVPLQQEGLQFESTNQLGPVDFPVSLFSLGILWVFRLPPTTLAACERECEWLLALHYSSDLFRVYPAFHWDRFQHSCDLELDRGKKMNGYLATSSQQVCQLRQPFVVLFINSSFKEIPQRIKNMKPLHNKNNSTQRCRQLQRFIFSCYTYLRVFKEDLQEHQLQII